MRRTMIKKNKLFFDGGKGKVSFSGGIDSE